MLASKLSSSVGTNSASANYIEDVFSTYLYTGNGSTQTINNGIDLAGKGGLVWLKSRNNGSNNTLLDTARGANNYLFTDTTDSQFSVPSINWSFNSTGFSQNNNYNSFNTNAWTYVSWTFRKQPKFFDVVTYTGTGSDPQTISHNLQSVPGCIIIKCTSNATNWRVHSTALDMTLTLNTTNAGFTPDGLIKNLTSSTFQVNNSTDVNNAGYTYVAYLFAHNAGGFGLTGTDNVISCGSFTGNGNVTLGYEPQYVLIKRADSAGFDWNIVDSMRGYYTAATSGGNPSQPSLQPNTSYAETSQFGLTYPTATGFNVVGISGTYIYIAIRKGPMKVPTDATKVFSPQTNTGTGSTQIITSPFSPDAGFRKYRGASGGFFLTDKLRGPTYLMPSQTQIESSLGSSIAIPYFLQNSFQTGSQNSSDGNGTGLTFINYLFQRAPSFFDEVCYTGDGTASRAVPHNLSVAPELMIVRARNLAQDWYVYNGAKPTYYLTLNSINSESNSFNIWGGTATSTNFYVNNIGSTVNDSGYNFVAYLFATCPGVSKVGSYTGTGTLTTINCGFTGGARYVLIKRTDASGGWYVWDTARGMVSGTDPSLRLNNTAAESNANSVYTITSGFQLLASPAVDVNTSGGTYIYLAIA